jgi:hypothetical protein
VREPPNAQTSTLVVSLYVLKGSDVDGRVGAVLFVSQLKLSFTEGSRVASLPFRENISHVVMIQAVLREISNSLLIVLEEQGVDTFG